MWVPCRIFWVWFGPALGNSGSKSQISGRIRKSIWGPFSSADKRQMQWRVVRSFFGLAGPAFSLGHIGRPQGSSSAGKHNCRPLLGGAHGRIVDFQFWDQPEQGNPMAFEVVSGADFDALSNIFRAGLVWSGAGAEFGREAAENRQNRKYIDFSFPV